MCFSANRLKTAVFPTLQSIRPAAKALPAALFRRLKRRSCRDLRENAVGGTRAAGAQVVKPRGQSVRFVLHPLGQLGGGGKLQFFVGGGAGAGFGKLRTEAAMQVAERFAD